MFVLDGYAEAEFRRMDRHWRCAVAWPGSVVSIVYIKWSFVGAMCRCVDDVNIQRRDDCGNVVVLSFTSPQSTFVYCGCAPCLHWRHACHNINYLSWARDGVYCDDALHKLTFTKFTFTSYAVVLSRCRLRRAFVQKCHAALCWTWTVVILASAWSV